MADRLGNSAVVRDPVTFTTDEIAQLESIYNRNDPSTYAAAYNYIHNLLSTKYKGSVDPDTIFWFKQAPQINVNSGNAALFIRTFTRIGLENAGEEVGDLDAVSNKIATSVIDDVARNGGVEALPFILAKDISVALIDGHVVDLSGRGGTFYYWDMPLVDSEGGGDCPRNRQRPDGLHDYRRVYPGRS